MDSPAFQFSGVTEPIINQKVGVNHINGIYIRPEYPVYSTAAEQVTFILNNYSGGTIECGERYYVTFEDEKGIWRELPMNTAFVSIAYVIQDKREREMRASLYPDVHPNKAGRYRSFCLFPFLLIVRQSKFSHHQDRFPVDGHLVKMAYRGG